MKRNYKIFKRRARVGVYHAVGIALSDRKLQMSASVYVSLPPPAESIFRLCSPPGLGISDG